MCLGVWRMSWGICVVLEDVWAALDCFGGILGFSPCWFKSGWSLHTMSSQLFHLFLRQKYQNLPMPPFHKWGSIRDKSFATVFFFISPMNGHWWLNRQQELLLGGFWLGQRFCLLLACATGRADDGPGGKKGSSRSLQHPLRFTPYKI